MAIRNLHSISDRRLVTDTRSVTRLRGPCLHVHTVAALQPPLHHIRTILLAPTHRYCFFRRSQFLRFRELQDVNAGPMPLFTASTTSQALREDQLPGVSVDSAIQYCVAVSQLQKK